MITLRRCYCYRPRCRLALLLATAGFLFPAAAQQGDDFPPFRDGVTPLIGLRSMIPADFFSPAVGGSTDPDQARTPDRLQHDFDIYSWETFIALCWPANPDGSPKEGDPEQEGFFTYPAGTVWESWIPAESIFREGAQEPIEWGERPKIGELYGSDVNETSELKIVGPDPATTPEGQGKGKLTTVKDAYDQNLRSISWIGTNFAGANHDRDTKTLEEVNQAMGSGRLIDHTGHFVRYEVLVNHPAYKYIDENHFYDQTAQEKHLKDQKRIVFPFGKFEGDTTRRDPSVENNRPVSVKGNEGSILIKAAWRVLDQEEVDSGRFYTIRAVTQLAGDVKDEMKKEKSLCHFGLIALHIVHKSADVAQWTWSTFEHDDNCPDVREVKAGIDPQRKFSFFNPAVFKQLGYAAGEGGRPAVNQLTDLVALPKPVTEPLDPVHHSRLVRLLPLTRDVTALNKQFKAKLSKSIWKNYSLVSTQWPLEPAGVFLGKGEFPANPPIPVRPRVRRPYAELNGDVELYNSGEYALDELRLTPALLSRPLADKQLGFPDPRILANTIIESNQQGIIDVSADGEPTFRIGMEHGTSSCMHCHGDAKTFGVGGRPSDMTFLLSRAHKPKP